MRRHPIRFAFTGTPNWQGHCHCESCRRATSSPVTSFLGVPNANWRWIGDQPQVFNSSTGVRRMFCATCGSPMAYEADIWPDETHFYAASLDDPAAYAPEFHVFAEEAMPWCPTRSSLKRYPASFGS